MTSDQIRAIFAEIRNADFEASPSKMLNVVEIFAVELNRTANALERIAAAFNEANEYGEVGSAAVAGAIARGLRNG